MKSTTSFNSLKALALVFLLLCGLSASAKQIPTVTGILKSDFGMSSPVVIGTPSAVNTILVPVVGGTADYNIHNTVSLKYDLGTDTFFLAQANVKVKVSIARWDAAGNPMAGVSRKLSISVNNKFSSPLLEQSSVNLVNGYKITMTIDSIWVNGVTVSTLPRYVSVESEINMDRYYNFSSSANTAASPNALTAIDNDCDGTDDEVELAWSVPSAAPEEYQLEWTYVNNYSATGGTYPAGAFDADFRNNSTRITTYNNSYKVSLLFDKGYVAFRVRAVGRDYLNPSLFVYGPWSSADIVNMGSLGANELYTVTQEHEKVKNWQYATTYAEEGKKKEVISYFDGSLHNRQTVTKINSDKNVIVGETIYDFQGRPAVNVLPVPVVMNCVTPDSEPSIKYYTKFNVDDTNKVYSKNDFDSDPFGNCISLTGPMDTVSGASRYYSNNNPDQGAQQSYVPHAKQYPFSQIEYTPDNTGRIRNQSGVGLDYKLRTGLETKYLYGQPNQIQVDRLFGSETGDASHYKKNVVIDANGQTSVSYLNQEGKTIATALAGVPPVINYGPATRLDSLSYAGQNQNLLTIDLFNKNALGTSTLNTIPASNDQISFSTQLLVTFASLYEFKYDLTVDTLGDPCLRNNICISCVYDMEIQIKDECGIDLAASPVYPFTPIKRVTGKVDTTGNKLTFNINCTLPHLYKDSAKVNLVLQPGVYTVSKVLKVNQEARDFYVKNYLDSANNSCVKTLKQFQAAELAKVDTMDCYNTCASCAAALGQRDDFVSAGKGTAAQWDFLVNQCLEPCRQKTLCQVTYEMMLSDVSPGGQYAKFDATTFSASSEPLSILNTSNQINANTVPGQQAHWKAPLMKLNGSFYNYYLNENGVRTKVNLIETSPGIYQPPVDNALLVFNDPATSVAYTYPENLQKLEDFISVWDPGFARSLVVFHPEYAYYVSCSEQALTFPGDSRSSDNFDSLLMASNTFTQALVAGLILPTYTSAIPALNKIKDVWLTASGIYDPFFTNVNFHYTTVPNIMSGTTTNFNMAGVNPYNVNLQTEMDYIVKHYQFIGTVPYTMADVAAILTRCGNNFNAIPTASCMAFGADFYPFATPLNDSIRDAEWRMFRQFYFSEKQKLQYKRMNFYAKHTSGANSDYFGGCNACIGTTNYNAISSGMVVLAPGPVPYPISAFFDLSQPCGYSSNSNYGSVTKRFYDPANTGLNPGSVAQQIYQNTGQCPMAFQLQNFLSTMAGTSKLTSVTNVNLNTVNQFNYDLYDAINLGISPSVFINYQWDLISAAGSVLTAHIVDPVANTNNCTVTLDKTGTSISSFSDILSLSQLMYDPTGVGPGAFKAQVVYSTGSSTATATIKGNSCIDVKNCSFTPECTPNQFASEMSNLLSYLKASGDLLSVSPIAISTNTAYATFLTPTIKNTLGSPSTNIYYQFVTPDKLTLYDAANPTTKIVLTITNINPPGTISSIMSFANIRSNYNNLFKMDGMDASGFKIASIEGKAERITPTQTVGISMGSCGLPDPPECAETEHKIRKDLELLVNEILTTKPFNTNVNLFTLASFSSLLQSYIPTNLNATSSIYTSGLTASPNFDTLKIKAYSIPGTPNVSWCAFNLFHYRNNGTTLNFANIIRVEHLTGIGTPDIAGNYTKFKALATYSVGGVVSTDTIYGNSCWTIKNCDPCPPNPVTDSLKRMERVYIQQGKATTNPDVKAYAAYKKSIEALNSKMGWKKGKTNYVEPKTYLVFAQQGYRNARPYLKFVDNFDPLLDEAMMLNIDSFIIHYGNSINCSREYARYVKAMQVYVKNAGSDKEAPEASVISEKEFSVASVCSKSYKYINYLRDIKQLRKQPEQRPEGIIQYTQHLQEELLEEEDPCQEEYINFVATINAYNSSPYSTVHSHTLNPNIYPTYYSFAHTRYCDCVYGYRMYLNDYLTIFANMALPLPVSIDQFEGCMHVVSIESDTCSERYGQYINVVNTYNNFVDTHPGLGYPTIETLFTVEEFMQYCICAPKFMANLTAISNGNLQPSSEGVIPYLDLPSACEKPCTNGPPDSAFVFPPYTQYDNPCVAQKINLAMQNGANAYQQYKDSMTTAFAARYTKHCLGALENFTTRYVDKEYHFTLYYYDQAGNLVRTIPPEGVEFIPVTSFTDPLEQKIISDRTYNQQTVFTNHRMPTTYVYNSLNQLTAQSIPDHDMMDICDGKHPNGLDTGLVILSVQFVTPTKGYLCGGLRDASGQRRGLAYTSSDGGNYWTRMDGIPSGDLQKVQFISPTDGFAVSTYGMVFKTIDGGDRWDLLLGLYKSMPGGRYVDHLTDLYFTSGLGLVGGYMHSSSSPIFYTTDGGNSFTPATVTGAVPGDTITGFTYDGTTYIASVRHGNIGKLFTSTTGTSWTQVTDFAANNLRKVQYINNSLAYAVGEEGTLMKLAQAITPGNPPVWQLLPTGVLGLIKDIYFKNATDGVAIIDSIPGKGKIYKTFNGGISWQELSSPGEYYNSLQLYDASQHRLIAAGADGLLAKVLMNNLPFGMTRILNPATDDNSHADAILFSANGSLRTIAVSDASPVVQITMDAQATGAYWESFNTTAAAPPIPSGDALFEKVLMLDSVPANPYLKGILLTSNGALYSYYKAPFTSNLICHPVTVPGGFSGKFFSDITANAHTFTTPIYALDSINKNIYVLNFSGTVASATLLNNLSPITKNSIALDIHNSSNELMMVGESGHIEYTADITANPVVWSERTLNTLPVAITKVRSVTGGDFIAGGIDGALWKSTGSSATWQLKRSGTIEALTSIAVNSSGAGLISATHGRLYQLTGANTQAPTLTALATSVMADLTDVAIEPYGTSAYATAKDGQVLYMNDYNSGLVFFAANASPYPVNGVAFKTGSDAMVVGNQVFAASYYGTNAYVTTQLFPSVLRSIHFYDANNGLLIDSSNVIRKTTNGGLSWSVVLPAVGSPVLSKIYASATNKGVLIGASRYAAVVNGNVLTALSTAGFPLGTNLQDVNFNNTNSYGIIVGARTHAGKIEPVGSSYVITYLGQATAVPQTNFRAVHVFNNKSFIACGSRGAIYYYKNGVFTQQMGYAPPSLVAQTSLILKDIYFRDDYNGYVVGSHGAAYKVNLPDSIGTEGTSVDGMQWASFCPDALAPAYTTPIQQQNLDFSAVALAGQSEVMLAGTDANVTVAGFVPNRYARLLKEQFGKYSTLFWYDKLGRLIVSQNTKQFKKTNPANVLVKHAYSYTLYDALGRISEVGEKYENHAPGSPKFNSIFGSMVNGYYNNNAIDEANFLAWISGSGSRREVTKTYYDVQSILTGPYVQENLRKRVATSSFEDIYDGNDLTYNHATHYTYDIHGNVTTLWQENTQMAVAGHEIKQTNYEFDLISGKVNKVIYSPGNADQFIHRYSYDADNRITKVETSSNGLHYDIDAKYFYYAHGPLARTEYGKDHVQGLDYAYTLQGWIKGVNSNTLKSNHDMGLDGHNSPGNPNGNFARDIMGYTLNYYKGDYEAVNFLKWNTAASRFEAYTNSSDLANSRNDLYNGNISAMVTSISQPVRAGGNAADAVPLPLGTGYIYDQLNRLKTSRAFTNISLAGNAWTANGSTTAGLYRNTFTYDANGNIKTQVKRDSVGAIMDSLIYNYEMVSGKMRRNRLYHVNDLATYIPGYSDITDQGSFSPGSGVINVLNNYSFDEIGNLIRDEKEDIDTIRWMVTGKIKAIVRSTGSSKDNLYFDYDASGNRIAKHVYTSAGVWKHSLYYERDAQGNVLAMYDKKTVSSTMSYKLEEQHLYGSSRLGLVHPALEMIGAPAAPDTSRSYLGLKSYELSNHLGNVLSVISDKKLQIAQTANPTLVDHYVSDQNYTADYYPFGQIMPGRTFGVPSCETQTLSSTTYTVDSQTFASGNGGFTSTRGTTLSNVGGALNVAGSSISDGVNIFYMGGVTQKTYTVVPNTSYTLSVYVALNLVTCPGDKVKCEVLDGTTVIASYTVTASGTIQLPFFTGGASSITLKFSKLVGSPCSFQVDNLYLYYVDVQSQIVCDPTGTVLLSDDCSSISTWTGNGGASVNISAGKLEVSNAASSGNWYAECQTSVNLQAGITYTLDFDLDMGNCSTGSVMAQHVEWTISTYFTDAAYSTSGHKTIVFTATSTGPASLWFNKSYPASSCTFYIDNVILTGPSAAKDQYRYGFNGQEKDNEIAGAGNINTAEFWQYDTRLGRRWNVDPIFAKKPWLSPYHAFSNKPILNIDPNGASDHEYEVDGKTGEKKKISDMGGDEVDFNHYKGGEKDEKTEIVNSKTGETQLMSSSKNIEGYTRRNNETGWKELFNEFTTGTGEEKSLMYQNHPMNLELTQSPNFKEAVQNYLESGKTKFGTAPFFNPVSAGGNMTAQFMGKANYNFYEVGDKTVIIVIDSKSSTSWSLNPLTKNNESNNKAREAGKIIPESTTHQTYLMIVPTRFFKLDKK